MSSYAKPATLSALNEPLPEWPPSAGLSAVDAQSFYSKIEETIISVHDLRGFLRRNLVVEVRGRGEMIYIDRIYDEQFRKQFRLRSRAVTGDLKICLRGFILSFNSTRGTLVQQIHDILVALDTQLSPVKYMNAKDKERWEKRVGHMFITLLRAIDHLPECIYLAKGSNKVMVIATGLPVAKGNLVNQEECRE